MSWLFSEYLLKGIYLGLVLFVALQEPDARATGQMALYTLGGLALFLGIAAARKLREGYRVTGRLPAFLLFLLLESPGLVYAGVLLGAVTGALAARKPGTENGFVALFAGGAGLGALFWLLRHVQLRSLRLGLGLVLAGALVGGGLFWFQQHPEFVENTSLRAMFGLNLLLGLPIFYLLTFAGLAEESEVEIAAICAALGLALWTLAKQYFNYQSICLLVPLVLYYWYATRILPNLRVFKHVIRGIGYANVARYRPALLAFRRALQLDPRNTLARTHLWGLHRTMDWNQLRQEPETLALVDLDLCQERASTLLLAPGPNAEKLKEAHHLLDLVQSQRPKRKAVVHYWRAVAHTHARHHDQAAEELRGVLDRAGYDPDDPHRGSILLPAWQLALMLHPELNRKVGTPELGRPERRLEAIAVVERHLASTPDDPEVWNLKRLLYSGLTESDYLAVLKEQDPKSAADTYDFAGGGLKDFDHGYAQQLGLALIHDSARWQQGAEYLRVAGRGLMAQGPTIFQQLAQAYERAGNVDEVRRCYELAKHAGRAAGPKNLVDPDRQTYFSIVKLLGEQARARGDLSAALENYYLYAEYDRSGLETLRILADLHERKGEALAALRLTEQALLFNGQDKDLLARKDKYYFSVTPDEVRAHLDSIGKAFDVAYCLQKAKSLLEVKEADAELLEWAQHLTEVALAVQPECISAKVLKARCQRRRGEIDKAQALFEETRANKPEKFLSSDDEEAWFLCCRLLGEMYLYELSRPDLAVPCLNDFRQSNRSGADTMYKLGQAYEQLGDRVKAAKCYEHVTAYESHPLAPEAREALYRLQSG